MKNANPAPIGVISFGAAAFVVGSLFAGLFGALSPGNMLMSGIIAIMAGVILLAVTCLMVSGNALADSAVFSMWGATVFGFFSVVWTSLGIILIFWKAGVESPLAFLLLFTCAFSIAYVYYSYLLKIWSFVILFLAVAIGTLSGFAALHLGWAPGNQLTGYIFIFLALNALYIVFKEQLVAVLPTKD
ncbi:MAG: acetate uptake transporter family protein [Desulfitobacteriaceae bacterium]